MGTGLEYVETARIIAHRFGEVDGDFGLSAHPINRASTVHSEGVFAGSRKRLTFAPAFAGKDRRTNTKDISAMKAGIHPENYRIVIFKDMSNDTMFLGKSCTNTKDSMKWEDGNEYPLVKLDISSTSHPFYTGKMMLIDTAGRVDKFKKRFAKHTGIKAAAPEVAPEAASDTAAE